MKLIPLVFVMSIAVAVKSDDQFTFPPKFLSHNSGGMPTPDSSMYLPPESHTTIPYFAMKNENRLQYPYLPFTGTNAPMKYPTPLPLMLSSTSRPMDHDDNDKADKHEKQSPLQKSNRTIRSHPEKIERRDFLLKSNYQPIDRIDTKVPYGFVSNNVPSHPNPQVQNATPRSMIVSIEQHRNDALEQLRGAATIQGPQYLPAPGAPGVYISSTTETAIPILRLSNEMDLDGSFSYEALGADQTHYVQHSHMENTGTDKEEQVVEGSYSYVGDNGQTYTVHYVADSKGFRASGDHLPVAPPVPEIIQRAIQFNLAEEAKKPPNLKSWQNEDKENELSESERYPRFSLPPSRPLFTGKAPQSFSFGFAQAANNAQNNLVTAASGQNPVKTNNEFTLEQLKGNAINGGAISPQITFLASQGAHMPSANTQPSISRAFTTERTILPQLVNYEAAAKDSDQESNKALWRWQYGLNTNVNQTPEKNSISRSSAEGDNVIINFGDMTPEQYSNMIRSELEPHVQNHHEDQIAESSDIENAYIQQTDNLRLQNNIYSSLQQITSTENNFVSTHKTNTEHQNTYKQNHNYQFDEQSKSKQIPETGYNARSKLVTQNDFVPPSQTVTHAYDYGESSYEPRRIVKSSTLIPTTIRNTYSNDVNNFEIGPQNYSNHIESFSTSSPVTLENNDFNNFKNSKTNMETAESIALPISNYNNNYEKGTQNNLWPNAYGDQIENSQKVSTTEAPITTSLNTIRFNDFIVKDNKNDFKPILPSQTEIRQEEPIKKENTEPDIFEDNIFLKNLFKTKNNDKYKDNKIKEENKNYPQKVNIDRKPDKAPKFIQMQAKPYNDIKEMAKKPVDVADVLNFISAKHLFESVKVKPKSKYGSNNYHPKSDIHYIPIEQDRGYSIEDDEEEESMQRDSNNYRTNYYHPKELQGIIKNYKVLQRNNSAFNKGQDLEKLRRDLSPPPIKMTQANLPPLGRAGPSMKSYLPPIYV